MSSLPKCPRCHIDIRPTDYFCFNCGKNLKNKPPSTSLSTQLFLYAKCIIFPLLGIVWSFPYLRQTEVKSKLIGIVAIALTLISFWLAIILTKNMVSKMYLEVDKQLQTISL